MSHSMQGVYAPLPQSLSDSDSEKEISMEPVFGNYNKTNVKPTVKNNLSYSQNGHLFNNLSDDIDKVKRIRPKMSVLRKTAFVFSILLCFLPIVIFLWVLPCSDTNTCPIKISNWENEQRDVEFKGHINLVQGAFKNNLNLALMYKGSFNSPKDLKNGVMSFLGKNGGVAWDFRQENYPIKINCTLIDIDGNGINDCLVVDEKGLKAIETLSGEPLWHAHGPQEKPIPDLDMPVRIEDINNDGVDDLLSIYQKKTFFLISSNTGKVFYSVKFASPCISIDDLQKMHEHVRYKCTLRNETQTLFELAISDIRLKFENAHVNIIPRQIDLEKSKNMFVTGDYKLLLEVYGSCPHCQSKLTLYDSKDIIIKILTYKNTFVTDPVPFELNYPNVLYSDNHINGFICKIWEWNETPKKLTPVTHVHRRSIPIYNETYHLSEVTERVVLIIFHQNDTPVINVSMTEVYVICNGPDVSDCQPDYKNQKNSLLLADLDHDNSLELISYYSSYMKMDEHGYDVWNLISKVKVFRLEGELPKLYGPDNFK